MGTTEELKKSRPTSKPEQYRPSNGVAILWMPSVHFLLQNSGVAKSSPEPAQNGPAAGELGLGRRTGGGHGLGEAA